VLSHQHYPTRHGVKVTTRHGTLRQRIPRSRDRHRNREGMVQLLASRWLGARVARRVCSLLPPLSKTRSRVWLRPSSSWRFGSGTETRLIGRSNGRASKPLPDVRRSVPGRNAGVSDSEGTYRGRRRRVRHRRKGIPPEFFRRGARRRGVPVAYSSGKPHSCRLLAGFRPGNPIPPNPRFLRFGRLSSKKHALGGRISDVLDFSHTSVPPNCWGFGLRRPDFSGPAAESRGQTGCARPDAAKSRVDPNGKPG
jgi:hypothetical protein